MPTTTEILRGLTAVANDWSGIAIAWHVAIGAALLVVVLGRWRPGARTVHLAIAALPASVSALAFVSGNPFNGVVLAALSSGLVVLALLERGAALARPALWARNVGILMVVFGWAYPHFLAEGALRYLYAAPVGVVPCPTLAVAIGCALLAGAGARRAWAMTLAGVGAFYALFGVFRLGVPLDAGLLVGAISLAVAGWRRVVVEAPVEMPSAMRAAA